MRLQPRVTAVLASVCVISALLGPSATVRAGVKKWTPHAPAGANVYSATFAPSNPSIAYATVYGGTPYKSTDGGRTWTSIQNNLPVSNGPLFTAAVHPTNAQKVFVGAPEGVFVSTNGGRVWSKKDGFGVFDIEINPNNPQVMYASGAHGVFKSTDGGETWGDNPILAGNHTDLEMSPADPKVLWVVPFNGTLMRTENAGGDWDLAVGGLPADVDERDIAAHPTKADVAWLATAGDGWWKTTNGGDNWVQQSGLIGDFVYAIEVDPMHPNRLYVNQSGSLYRTTDGGDEWEWIQAPFDFPSEPSFHPQDTDILLLPDSDGIWRSTDAGITWKRASAGLNSLDVTDLVTSANDKRLYAATNGTGVFRSTNGGASWVRLEQGLLSDHIQDLAIAPSDQSVMYAAASGGFVHRSDDAGASWDALNGEYDHFVVSVAVRPSDPDYVLAGVLDTGNQPLYRTVSGDDDWEPVNGIPNTTTVHSLAFYNDNVVIAGTTQGVYRSIDAGASFGSVQESGTHFNEIVVDSSGTLYAATNDGVLKSLNGGVSWNGLDPHGLDGKTVASVEVDSKNPQTVFASARYDGVYRSLNGGETFKKMSRGLGIHNVETLEVDRSKGFVLHGGRSFAGISSYLLEPKLKKPPPVTRAREFKVSWTSASGHGVESYDVRVRKTNHNDDTLSVPIDVVNKSQSTSTKFTGKAGKTYCFEARARDKKRASNFARRCTIVPFDDRKLTGDASWTQATGEGLYEGTRTSTSTEGAVLTFPDVSASRVAVVYTKCPTCGKFEISVDGFTIGEVDGESATIKKRQVTTVYNSELLIVGDLEITPTQAADVHIDGLALGRSHN
jgi:photosystem II stability/assembly factor-like uncharacterized protein